MLDDLVETVCTKILAGIAELLYATIITNIGVVNQQMRRVILFVLGTGVIEIGEFVEGQFAVALGRAEQTRFWASVGGQIGKWLQFLVPRVRGYAVAESTIEKFLQDGVDHAGGHAVFESLVEVAHRPQLIMDPTGFDAPLKLAESCRR